VKEKTMDAKKQVDLWCRAVSSGTGVRLFIDKDCRGSCDIYLEEAAFKRAFGFLPQVKEVYRMTIAATQEYPD
jgi:hypothetical protein